MRLLSSLVVVTCLTASGRARVCGRKAVCAAGSTIRWRWRPGSHACRAGCDPPATYGRRPEAVYRLLGRPDAETYGQRTWLYYRHLTSTLAFIVVEGRVVSVGWSGNGPHGLPQ